MTPYRLAAPVPEEPKRERHSRRAWLRFQFGPAFLKCPHCDSYRCEHTTLVSYLCTGYMIMGAIAVLYAVFHKALGR